jgi:hypothetical protein
VIHLATTYPTARKAHQCHACLHTIRPGTRYERAGMIGDYGPYSTAVHLECVRAIDEIGERFDDGWPMGYLVEYAEAEDLPAWWVEWHDALPQEAP